MHTHTYTIIGIQQDTVHFPRPKPTGLVSNRESFASPLLLPPALALPGSLDEGPVDGDRLPEHLGAIEIVLGSQSLFVRLELDEGVAFEEPSSAIQIQV